MKQNKFLSVIVDANGGDNAPQQIVEGAILAVQEYTNLKVILAGDKQQINSALGILKFDANRVEILDAPDTILNDEAPADAIRSKRQSSLVVALERLKKDDDICALVSAGSTGAMLAGGFLKLGRLKGISRPALAVIMPTVNDAQVLLIDGGANMDTTTEQLEHFAIMGSLYMQAMTKSEKPKVALLNVGTEDAKGNELTKAAFEKFKALPINFVGNMEARDALSGKYEVIVCDGFAGNVLLKGIEGAVESTMAMLKAQIKASKKSMFGALLMKKSFKKLKQKLNHLNRGGSPLLGLKKIVIKSHGSSTAITIKTSIAQAIDLHQAGMIENLSAQLEKLNIKKDEIK